MSLISASTAVNFLAINATDFDLQSAPVEVSLALACGRHYQASILPSTYKEAYQDSPRITDLNINVPPKYADQVCNELNLLCAGSHLYVDHWGFTQVWLDRLFNSACVERAFTCSPIEALLEEDEHQSWNARKQFVMDVLGASDFSAEGQVEVMQAVVNLFYRDPAAPMYHKQAASSVM